MRQPFVAFFGGAFSETEKTTISDMSTPYFFDSDVDLINIMKYKQPHVLVTIGNMNDYKKMFQMSAYDRERWLHFNTKQDCLNNLQQLNFCFVCHAIKFHHNPELVTIFTSSYKSKEFIQRPFRTLLNQTYQNWEWIIFDDTDGDENFQNLVQLKNADPRIRVYRADKNSGVIGNMKNLSSSLARGFLLMEVDHDDELTPRAIEYLVQAAKDYPDAGFFHSDFVEIYEDGRNFAYGDRFGIGYGSYRKEWDENRKKWLNIVNAIPINAGTVRYLVASPNHFRAWRTSVFNQMGGWNQHFHVADDFEIMVRSFLNTKIVRIPENCYYQYRNAGGNNFTFIRNGEIQKLWYTIAAYYNNQIHQRLIDLDKEDKQSQKTINNVQNNNVQNNNVQNNNVQNNNVQNDQNNDQNKNNQLTIYPNGDDVDPDPYYQNWENWQQWERSWLRSRYDKPLNYTLKIKGRDPKNPLVSIVIICYDINDLNNVKAAIKSALHQSYPVIEIIVIGNACPNFEIYMDRILDSMPSVNHNRIKRDLKWWNTASKSNYVATCNYACKMTTLGDIIYLMDISKLHEIEKYDTELITKAVNNFVNNSDLQFIHLNNSRHIFHRASLYSKYGYWRAEKDLLITWSDNKESSKDNI